MTDTTAPKLKGLSFPSTFDVTPGAAPVLFGVEADDGADGSGMASVVLVFDKNVSYAYGAFPVLTLPQYADLDNFADKTPTTARSYIPFSNATAPGTYLITQVWATDVAGNKAIYYPQQLAALGIKTSFEVTGGIADATAPTLKSLHFPATIDLSARSTNPAVSAELTVEATDAADGTGVNDVIVVLDKNLTYDYGSYSVIGISNLTTADNFEDSTPVLARKTISIPKTAANGTYQIVRVQVADHAGNVKVYSAEDLDALGIGRTFDLTGSSSETIAPTLSALSFPTTIDLNSRANALVVGVGALDNPGGSGVASVTVTLDKPLAFSQGMSTTFSLSNASGGDTFQDTTPGWASQQFALTNAAATGTYRVASVTVTDGAGNQQTYTGKELIARGFKPSFTLVDSARDATYVLTASSPVVSEGATETFSLKMTNVAPGTGIDYLIAGTGSAAAASTVGTFIVDDTGSASVAVKVPANAIVADSGTLQLLLLNDKARSDVVVVNDYSSSPTYSLSASAPSVAEGGTETFTLQTTNIAAGKTVGYTVVGTGSATNAAVTGNFVVNAAGKASVAIKLPTNKVSGDSGTLQLSLTNGKAASDVVMITDASPVPTYVIDAGSASVAEGGTETFSLQTTGLATGTSVGYTITGTGDAAGASTTGAFRVDVGGKATVSVKVPVNSVSGDSGTLQLALTNGKAASNTVAVTDHPTSSGVHVQVAPASSGSNLVFKIGADAWDTGASNKFQLTFTYDSNQMRYQSVTLGGFAAQAVSAQVAEANGVGIVTLSGQGIPDKNNPATIDLAMQPLTDHSISYAIKSLVLNGASQPDGAEAPGKVFLDHAATSRLVDMALLAFADGGEGTDTAVFAGKAADYHVWKTATGFDVATSAGHITQLANVERVAFSDGDLALDTGGVGGQVYRLYQAAFDRQPDQGGVGYWMHQIEHGTSLADTAKSFIGSKEFADKYGGKVTSEDFVTALYNNVLHRAPDAGGFDYWVKLLGNGVDKATVLIDFSESPENVAQVIGAIENGFAYVPWQ